ncbi:MAG TPA: helix-turn-helix domain-containing protein [Bryobacteraceae bacterium]|nr:helix-turn-helix domain-containing protein [Bryobacteraceae bacterium]
MASSPATYGNLEQQRRIRGVSLQDIAAFTKISMVFLEAIERQQFATLPGGVFNRSYLRQYAAAAGVPEDQVLEPYEAWERERAQAAEPAAVPPRRPFGLRSIASSLFAAVDVLY